MKKPTRTKIYRLLPKYQPEKGRAFRRDVKVPAIDTIYEPLQGGGFDEKVIAYDRNRPLYVSEWNKDLDEVMKNPPNKIIWSSGIDIYPKPTTQGKLIEYLDKCNYNASNPNRDTSVTPFFEEFNPHANAVESIANEEMATIARYSALKGNIDKLREVMVLLGYKKNNPFGELYTEAEVRDMAKVFISRSPENADDFNEIWGDATIDYRINLNRGLSLNIIYIDQSTAEVKWKNNDKPALAGKVPIGVDILDHMVAFVNKGGKGKTFYDELLARIMGDDKTDLISRKFTGAINDAVEAMTPEQLATQAIDLGIIIRKQPFYVIADMADSKSARIAKSKDALIVAIKGESQINGVNLSTMIKTQIKNARV